MSEGFIPFRNYIPEPLEEASDPSRPRLLSSVLYPQLGAHQEALREFRQNRLMPESAFSRWARERGADVFGVAINTDVELFWRRGWLRVDQADVIRLRWQGQRPDPINVLDYDRRLGEKIRAAGRSIQYDLSMHPFRLYPLLRILEAMRWNLSRSSVLYGKGLMDYAASHVTRTQTFLRSPNFLARVDDWNGVADLAVLLEPLYWPKITGWQTDRTFAMTPEDEKAQRDRIASYRDDVLALTRSIPKAMLAGAHMDLRYEANRLDPNGELYLLLRASAWRRRETIQGELGGALWLRHIAEVIRLAYDELYEDRLVHEDEAGSQWFEGARAWSYGSEYPLDDPPEMVRRVLPRYGIASSPRVRFYVEGDTEEGALEVTLQRMLGFGVEIINLKSKGWDDWLLLQLEKDVDAYRLSLVMLDGDRKDHVAAIRRRVVEGKIVGMVFVNDPDIEIGNFSLSQLVRAAYLYEEEAGRRDLPPLDEGEFTDVRSGKEFENVYKRIRLSPGLKGNAWGRALMRIAYEDRQDEGDDSNQLVYAVACAIRAMTTDYVASMQMYRIDPETLKTIPTGERPF